MHLFVNLRSGTFKVETYGLRILNATVIGELPCVYFANSYVLPVSNWKLSICENIGQAGQVYVEPG
jgi:hypothetical protein